MTCGDDDDDDDDVVDESLDGELGARTTAVNNKPTNQHSLVIELMRTFEIHIYSI